VTHPLLLEGRYQLEDLIGAGGMGEVWRATDLTLRRRVAVKLVRSEVARDAERLVKFRAEARSAAAVSHPGIAQVYDYSEDPSGLPYLVMELVEGTSLDRLLEDGPLGVAFTMSIVDQVAQGLAAAHAAGVLHRDIKPQNLLATRDGQIKITDFGIARMMGSAVATSSGVLVCTPAYLAPERGLGAAATPAADLYALGIVAYQCLTGQLPFTGEPLAVMLAHQNQPLPPLPRSVPAKVAALVAALTAKSPEERPGSATQVATRAAQLHDALGPRRRRVGPPAALPAGTPGEPPPASMRPAGHNRRGRRPVPLAGRAGLALGGVGVLGLAGWLVVQVAGFPGVDQQLSGRPATAAPPHPHRPAGAVLPKDHPTASDPARTLRAHGHRKPHPAHHSRRSPSPKPKRSPTPSASPGTPSPAPTPSATSPAPSPDPTPSTPSPVPSTTPTSTS
jgi:eukaryotic-like serine/threonine-protein kinase